MSQNNIITKQTDKAHATALAGSDSLISSRRLTTRYTRIIKQIKSSLITDAEGAINYTQSALFAEWLKK